MIETLIDKNSETIISDITQIITENDFARFEKKEVNSSQYVITENTPSEKGIFFQIIDHTVDQEIIERVKDILSLHESNRNRREEINLGRKAINLWLLDNVVNENLNCKTLKRFLMKKKNVDPWTFFFLIKLVEKIAIVASIRLSKKIEDLTRQDICDQTIYREFIQQFNNKNEIVYLNNFMKEMSTFNQVELTNVVPNSKVQPLNHPLVNFYVKELRKKGTKEQSIYNNHIVNIRRFFSWLCSICEEHKGFSINNILVHRIKVDHVNDYKAYLVKQVKNEIITELGAKKHLQYIKSFFTLLYQKKRITNDVSFYITNLNAEEFLYRDIPSFEETREFMKVISIYSDDPIKEKLAFSLMLHLGFRGSEVANLRWEDLNIGNETVAINDSKGENTLLPLPTFLADDFKRMEVKVQGLVFSDSPTAF